MTFQETQKQQDEKFEKTFGKNSDMGKFLALKYGTNIHHLRAEEEIKSYLHQRDAAIISAIKETIEALPTQHPERESDEYDAGLKAMKDEIIEIIKNI